MDKETKKRTMYNEDFLIAIEEKYGVSVDYIRKSLRGDRVGIMPDKIKSEYKALVSAQKKIIDSFKQN